jgi:Arc/MetJ family transcription regulator
VYAVELHTDNGHVEYFDMARTRTSLMLDDALVARTKKVMSVDSTSDLMERLMREALRRDSLRQLAAALRRKSPEDDKATAAPRRRPA